MYDLQYNSVCTHFGSLYSPSGREIDKPSLLIDDGVLLGYGNYDNISKKFQKLMTTNQRLDLENDSLKLISFDRHAHDEFGIDDICYIFRRAIEFSGTSFIQDLSRKWGTEEFLPWLKAEQKRIELETERFEIEERER